MTMLQRYLTGGAVPWTPGYYEYRNAYIAMVLDGRHTMDVFRFSWPLPENFGVGLDERVVEYPWVIARLSLHNHTLDAGGTLGLPEVRRFVRCAGMIVSTHIEYADVDAVIGDLRSIPARDESFDTVVCISTLEHIGCDQEVYGGMRENRPESWRDAVREFQRVLRPDGSLLITVPFGWPEHFGWFRQFGADDVRAVEDEFGALAALTCYGYSEQGWQLANPAELRFKRYFDVRKRGLDIDPDRAAAARGVACMEFRKPS